MNMNLGVHYHIEVYRYNNKLYTERPTGLFIDSLANRVVKLYLYAFETNISKENMYLILSKNVHFVKIEKGNFLLRTILFHKYLSKINFQKLDLLLVRGPTPLLPFFHFYINRNKIVFYIVGSYYEVQKNLIFSLSNIPRRAIVLISSVIHFIEIMRTKTIVNSLHNKKRFEIFKKQIHFIKTSTLNNQDFFKRDDTCQNSIINFLYVGRVEIAKGIIEIIEALNLINNEFDFRFNIVGDYSKSQNDFKTIISKIEHYNLNNKIKFYGNISDQKKLFDIYRISDIFLIPSHHEGFPRVIWEAMANSLPVITSNVGSIPSILNNNINSIIIPPKRKRILLEAILKLVSDENLRKKIIYNAYELAKNNTLDSQTDKLINVLNEFKNN